MTRTATTTRSELLRGRIRDLDALRDRAAPSQGAATDPAMEAKEAALAQRIRSARRGVTGELAFRDRMERLRSQGSALRRDGLARKETIERADAVLIGLEKALLEKYPRRTVQASDLPPEDRARYGRAKNARDAARRKLDEDREDFRRRKDQHDGLRGNAESTKMAEGDEDGDVADPCVSFIPSEAEKLREEQAKAREERLVLARSLVRKGGSGTDEDRELVAVELAVLPKSILEQFEALATTVVACRDSVTDYRTDLRGIRPGSWRPGDTWDWVPGACTLDRKEVVVATRGHGTSAGAHVPVYGEGHGSSNLAVHVAMQALDSRGSGPDRSTATIPSLDEPARGEEQRWFVSGEGPEESNRRVQESIGVARMLPDGMLVLDLRATDAEGRGFRGDARFLYAKTAPVYPEFDGNSHAQGGRVLKTKDLHPEKSENA